MLEVAWPPPWVREIPEDAERDEHEAMREGLCDLMRLAPLRAASVVAAQARCSRIHDGQIGGSPYWLFPAFARSFVQEPRLNGGH